MFPPQFRCPHCQGLFHVDPSLCGRQTLCPNCRGELSIPAVEGVSNQPLEPAVVAPPLPQVQCGCPYCSGVFQIDANAAGGQVSCPFCLRAVTIPPAVGSPGPIPPQWAGPALTPPPPPPAPPPPPPAQTVSPALSPTWTAPFVPPPAALPGAPNHARMPATPSSPAVLPPSVTPGTSSMHSTGGSPPKAAESAASLLPPTTKAPEGTAAKGSPTQAVKAAQPRPIPRAGSLDHQPSACDGSPKPSAATVQHNAEPHRIVVSPPDQMADDERQQTRHPSTAGDRSKVQLIKNVILWTICLIVLVIAIAILRWTGPLS